VKRHGRFLDRLTVTRSRKGWVLVAPFRYDSGAGIVEVPPGFETDFASVPRAVLAFVIAGDRAHEAATIHDWLYHAQTASRALADALFFDAMACPPHAEPRWRRRGVWLAVRLFGGRAWVKSRRAR